MLLTFKQKLKSFALKYAPKLFLNGSYFLNNPTAPILEPFDLETTYISKSSQPIPVYSNYRYSLKTGWQSFPGLYHLNSLYKRNKLMESQSKFLQYAKGKRTVMVSAAEALDVAKQAIHQNETLFYEESSNEFGLPHIKPDKITINSTVDYFYRSHTSLLTKLASLHDFHLTSNSLVLEIGYTSGGHSQFAFERLGLQVAGVDNFYGTTHSSQNLHQILATDLNSHVHFATGDITSKCPFDDESFDFIYSTSVLEHVQDLPSAFSEMHRLLKPGGMIVHNYHPYFCHDGAHALGIGDSPWQHVRLSEDDYITYIKDFRPYEADLTYSWITTSLDRNTPQWLMQRHIVEAGFNLLFWNSLPSPSVHLTTLTTDVISDCLSINPSISIEDLFTKSVTFHARKNF